MQDIFENAKRMANTAVERAAWEADRLRRSGARQRDVDIAQRERAALLEQLGSVVLDLDRRGQLTSEPLKAMAARLRTLDNEISKGQADARAIRMENFTPGTAPFSAHRNDAGDEIACPTCGKPTRGSAAFCSACGARLH